MAKKIIIVGAGLCGTLLAIRLAERGMMVVLAEKRPDIRKMEFVGGRSINLALSNRGLKALRLVGLENEILEQCIPMPGRRIHPLGRAEFTSPYSGRGGYSINSVSRGELNSALLNKAASFSNLEMFFNTSCTGVDFEKPKACFEDHVSQQKFEIEADYIFGADGSNSAVRNSMLVQSHQLLFSYSQSYLSHAYKELTIPADENGYFRIEKNALHIWPRGGFMMIALPNLDGSFTVTLFLAHKGENSFEQLKTGADLRMFFEKNFPDALPHMPGLEQDFFSNPTGLLATYKCEPWLAGDKVMLMGDAAHAIVPFYGQGMNASFEDVTVFDELLDFHQGDMDTTLKEYSSIRKKDTDAIADLAIDNFYEMRDHVADPVFQLKRQLEMKLERSFKLYRSKYSMVTFNENIPYEHAMKKGRAQDEKLMKICKEIETVNEIDLKQLYKELKKLDY
jgi:kynurenine 3-monooxygenase